MNSSTTLNFFGVETRVTVTMLAVQSDHEVDHEVEHEVGHEVAISGAPEIRRGKHGGIIFPRLFFLLNSLCLFILMLFCFL